MTRKIVLDTETTGLSTESGDRLIEIAGVELIHNKPTMRHFHVYINPDREVSEGAFKVHGISNQFLSNKPRFANVVHDMLDFLQNSTLVIHNASFDMKFLNHELALLSMPSLTNPVIDTLKLAREKFPGQRASLDALCNRFKLSLTQRKEQGHGALLDAKLLTQVYLNLVSDTQLAHLDQLDTSSASSSNSFITDLKIQNTQSELDQFNTFIKTL